MGNSDPVDRLVAQVAKLLGVGTRSTEAQQVRQLLVANPQLRAVTDISGYLAGPECPDQYRTGELRSVAAAIAGGAARDAESPQRLPGVVGQAPEVSTAPRLAAAAPRLPQHVDPEVNADPSADITALVYYIPAAGMVELYLPALSTCAPFDIRHDAIPTKDHLRETAQQAAGKRRVRLEFRPPREEELGDAPSANPLTGTVGYGVPGFGHILPGWVRTATPRLPGTAAVSCPPSWFT